MRASTTERPKAVDLVPIAPPPAHQRVRRAADFPREGERPTRHTLPTGLVSGSPVGYRTRVALTRDEGAEALALLSMERPTAFVAPEAPVRERELFEECALGPLSSRQSTNYRGFRDVLVGPAESARVAELLRRVGRREAPVLDGAAYTHLVLSRPYRTPFTFLLTFIGHRPLKSLGTVPLRAWHKRFSHVDDIPTIGYLQQLHLGILADAMERAAVIASAGARRAQVFLEPFDQPADEAALRELEALAGMTRSDRARGWRLALVAQVGAVAPRERVSLSRPLCRKLGANLLAFRSERTQPGVNADPSAPAAYQQRQDMDVPEALVTMVGRAGYNAFAHWSGCARDAAKSLLLMERIDVLTENGKQRLRDVRASLDAATDAALRDIPLWADLPLGRALSRNLTMGRKAFGMTGQRIYVGGLSRREVEASGLGWDHAVRAFGAAASRSALMAELMGCVELPDDCDLLAGLCLMAGPVNQNDIGKQFYGHPDLLAKAFPDRDPTSLLVWTLKAKTVADPIGNEEQLMNPKRKGMLVDLRPAPHEVISLRADGRATPLRAGGSRERAFGDVGNFVRAPDGREIPGNAGEPWPAAQADAPVWT